jgi:hypothetical protein
VKEAFLNRDEIKKRRKKDGEEIVKFIINVWIERKMKDYYEVRNRPHPYEMNLYYEA